MHVCANVTKEDKQKLRLLAAIKGCSVRELAGNAVRTMLAYYQKRLPKYAAAIALEGNQERNYRGRRKS